METEGGEGTAGGRGGKVAAGLMKHEMVTVGAGGLNRKLACAPDKNSSIHQPLLPPAPHFTGGALLPYFFPKCFAISCRHYLPIAAAPFCDMCVRRTCVASLSGEFCAWE